MMMQPSARVPSPPHHLQLPSYPWHDRETRHGKVTCVCRAVGVETKFGKLRPLLSPGRVWLDVSCEHAQIRRRR
jgi:hypothetical protein